MANNQNLIPLNERSKEEREAIQAKGRAKFKEKCERLRRIREMLEAVILLPGEDKLPDGSPSTWGYDACKAVVKHIIETGDASALEKVMVALGQKPADKVQSQETVKVTYQWRE